ncbi:ABC transporter permease [Thermostilla marina]
MVSVLDRKLLRDMRSSGILLASIIGITALGVSLYVAMGSAHRNLSETKRRYYVEGRMADFSISLKKAPETEIRRLLEIPGVTEIRSRIRFYTTIDLPHLSRSVNGMVLSLPDRRRQAINDIHILTGGYFTDRRRNEVILNDAFAREHDLGPGDWITVVMNDRRERLYVVGTALSCEFIYLVGPGSFVPDRKYFGVLYVKRSYAEDVYQYAGAANQVLGRLSPDAHPRVREILRRAEAMLDDYGVFSTTPLDEQPSNRYVSQEIEGLRTFGFVIPGIFLVVVAVVLNVLMRRMVDHQRAVTGTLKALGYSDAAIFLHFLKYSVMVGLAGGIVGCALGYRLADLMTIMYREVFEFPELITRFYPDIHFEALGVALLFAVVGGIRGSRMALRLQPAEAMRPKPPAKGGSVWLERFPRLWSRVSTSWRMVLRQLLRNRLRTSAGVFVSTLGASILMMIFTMALSVERLVDFQFRWTYRSDLDITLRDEHGWDVLLEARRLPGVRAAEPILDVPCTFYSGPIEKKGAITGILPDAQLTVPRDKQGRRVPLPESGLLMSRTLARILHVKPGDEIAFRPVKGDRVTRTARIEALVDGYLGTVVYADLRYLNRLLGEEDAVSRIQLGLSGDDASREAVYRQLKQTAAVEGISARADMIDNLYSTVLKNLWAFLSVEILFGGMLFFGNILNSSMVSLAERQRELATLRVLGYGPWEIGSLLLRESMIVTLAGTVIGLPLGYVLTIYAVHSYQTEMFRMPLVFSAWTALQTILWAVVFTLAAHAIVQRSVHRFDWFEAVKTRE